MSAQPEEPNDSKFEIGHVLFIDIVGYSKLLIEEQKERLRKLTEIVLATPQVAKSTDEQLVTLPTGDGMALVFRNSSEEPVRGALQIAEALKAHSEMAVRMGIHSGPVSEVTDVSGRTNIAGPGINMAQRVMDCGDAGHILVSQHVAEDLSAYRHWSQQFHPLGPCEVKHGVLLNIFNLYGAKAGNADRPLKLKHKPAGKSKAWNYRIAIAGTLAALVFLKLVLYSLVWKHNAPSGPVADSAPQVIRSLAVLPLDNYSGDKSQDYFAEGMTDEITTDLATISQLRVISRSSTTQFAGAQRPPTPAIARLLNVDALVEGSVRRSGDKVRITAQLIDARADRHLWAKTFEGDSRDVLALQDQLASAIAGEINVQLTPSEKSRLSTARVVNPEAHDAYLKGRYFFNRPSDENLNKAIAQFEQAVALDSDFAPAHSGLSDAYLWAAFNEGTITAREAKAKTKAAAKKALALDPASAEAHTSLANYKSWYEHDWAGADQEFRRAIALNPNYAFAHDQWALSLGCEARCDEAIVEGRRAVELDPLDPAIAVDNTLALTGKGSFQAAIDEAKRGAELDPTFFFPQMQFGWIDLQQGNVRAALPQLEKAAAMKAPPFATAYLGYAYGLTGDRTRALATIKELKKKAVHDYVPPFNLALVHLGLGDFDQAIALLEQASADDSQWMMYLKMDHVFDPLRSKPRFQALMKKENFE